MNNIIYKLKWVYDRWKIMQHPQEELYRFGQQVQYRITDKKWVNHPPVKGGFTYNADGRKLYSVEKAREVVNQTVGDIKRYPVLNAYIEDVTTNTRWNYDFVNKVQGQCRFVHGIDAFDYTLGDYRYYYELGRLHWLPMFALLGATGRKELIAKSKQMLNDWREQNPFMQTVAWQSANEVGIRVINLIYYRLLLDLCDEPVDKETERMLEEMVELHYRFITSHLSLYSSKGNHHTGEMAGVIAICCTYRFKHSEEVLARYYEELQSEIMRLLYKDGFDREQSSNYLTSYINLNVTALMMAKQKGFEPRPEVWERVRMMYDALDKMRVRKGEFFHLGDTDNAELLFPYMDEDYNIYESQLNDGVILFGNARYADYHYDVRNYLLFGDESMATYQKAATKEMGRLQEWMPEAGYYVVRDERVNMLFDAGEIGLWPQMCHGHADMLNVLLYHNGRPVLVDCGCYQYNAYHKKYRDYFHGSRSHNVVTVNGQDQAQLGAGMFWLNKPEVHVSGSGETETEAWCEAYHTGYKDCTHKRRVCYRKQEQVIEITDTLTPTASEVEIAFHLHFHPQAEVSLLEGVLKVAGVAEITNELTTNGRLLRGSDEEPYGWFSERYDKKEPTTTFVATRKIEKETIINTKIKLCAEY